MAVFLINGGVAAVLAHFDRLHPDAAVGVGLHHLAHLVEDEAGDFLASDQGKSELNIGAHSGDIVQWTVTDPTSGQEYSPVLYGFTTGNAAALTPPQMISETLNVFQPQNVQQPTGPFTSTSYPDYVWQSTLVKPGVQIQYSWKFVIIDNNGTNLGAYTWDPFITVS